MRQSEAVHRRRGTTGAGGTTLPTHVARDAPPGTARLATATEGPCHSRVTARKAAPRVCQALVPPGPEPAYLVRRPRGRTPHTSAVAATRGCECHYYNAGGDTPFTPRQWRTRSHDRFGLLVRARCPSGVGSACNRTRGMEYAARRSAGGGRARRGTAGCTRCNGATDLRSMVFPERHGHVPVAPWPEPHGCRKPDVAQGAAACRDAGAVDDVGAPC